jgi:ABC-type iron transport system FetAB ATPase subunit
MDFSFLEKEELRLSNLIKKEKSQLKELHKSINIRTQVKEIITKMLYIKKQEMKVLVDIVNKGLEYTYPDKQLIFKMEFEEKNNKIVPEFYLNELQLKPPFIGDGGGIISTIGLLIYLTFIKLKNIKILLLDECESMVDLQATQRLLEFIDFFAKENNITVIIITHKQLEDYKQENITDKISILKVGD